MFKLFLWVSLVGGGILIGLQIGSIYYNNNKILSVFEGATIHLKSEPATSVKRRLPDLLAQGNVDLKALPGDFFDQLRVTKVNGKLKIVSAYHITLWVLGEPQSVDYKSEFSKSDVEPMDKIRLRARFDFDFSPTRVTP